MAITLMETIEEFQLGAKLDYITADNAANNGTMFRHLEKLMHQNGYTHWDHKTRIIPCLAHVLNLAVQAFLKALKINRPEKKASEEVEKMAQSCQCTSRLSKTAASPTVDEMEDKNIPDDAFLDYFRNMPSVESANFRNAIVKLRRLYSLYTSASHCDSFLDLMESMKLRRLHLIMDCATRWNSTYKMLERAWYLKDAVPAFMAKQSNKFRKEHGHLLPTSVEWDLIEMLLYVLRPFYECTIILEPTKSPTIQNSFISWNSCFNALDKIQTQLHRKKLVWKRELGKSLQIMRDRLAKYYSLTSIPSVYVDSTILTPFMKLRPFKTAEWEPRFADKYRNECHQRYQEKYASRSVKLKLLSNS